MTHGGSSIKLAGSNTALNPKPISYKFGGTAATLEVSWSLTNSVQAREFDQSYYSGKAFTFDIDFGELKRPTNLLFRFKANSGTDVSAFWQGILECKIDSSFPVSQNQQTYSIDDIFYSRRPASDYLYFNLPRNRKYRYARLKFFNPSGTSGGLKLTDIYFGDSVDLDQAPSTGISHQSRDLSTVFTSESGREYYFKRPIVQDVGALNFDFLDRNQIAAMKIWSDKVGTTTPFWMILDPWGGWDSPQYDATFGAYRMVSLPIFTHQFYNIWSVSMQITEVI